MSDRDVSDRVIELHDSTIEETSLEGGDLLLSCTVYVREDGEGAFRNAVIRVREGVSERDHIDLPCLLEGGTLVLNGERYDDGLPAPLDEAGEVALLLSPADSSEFVVRGAGIEIELLDPQD